jgi:hypothetical protein
LSSIAKSDLVPHEQVTSAYERSRVVGSATEGTQEGSIGTPALSLSRSADDKSNRSSPMEKETECMTAVTTQFLIRFFSIDPVVNPNDI